MIKYFIFIAVLLLSCNTKKQEDTSVKISPRIDSTNTQVDRSLIIIQKEKIKNHIQSYVDKGEFSGSILVAKGGTILFKGAFGYADYNKKIQNEVDTKFLIGSTTKSFTAILLLRLYQKGLVNLDVPISHYLKDLKSEISDKLTLDILLRMKSGLPNHLSRLVTIDHEEKQISTNEILKIINKANLEYTPNSEYSYSNLNYHLIAAIIESVTNLTYLDVLQNEILVPLKMENTGTFEFHSLTSKKALNYHVGSLEKVTEPNNLYYALGSGNVYSTVEDIYRLDRALYDDSFLADSIKKRAFKQTTKELGYYGYGFRIREYARKDSSLAKGKLVRHGGMMKGYLANFHRYIDDEITVIILGNISMFPIQELTTQLKDIAIDF